MVEDGRSHHGRLKLLFLFLSYLNLAGATHDLRKWHKSLDALRSQRRFFLILVCS